MLVNVILLSLAIFAQVTIETSAPAESSVYSLCVASVL